jgi:hypothetical protein
MKRVSSPIDTACCVQERARECHCKISVVIARINDIKINVIRKVSMK